MSNTGKSSTKSKSDLKREESVIYRVLIGMIILAVVICALVFLYNRYQKMAWFLTIYTTVFYLAIVTGIAAAACAAAALAVRKRAKARKYLLTAMGWLLATAASCVIMRVYSWEGIVWLFIAWPAALILYIIYLLYPLEFFFMALEGGVSGISFFVLYKMGATFLRPWIIVLLALFLIVCTVLSILARKDGQVRIRNLQVSLCSGPHAGILLLATSALSILGLLLTVLAGGVLCLISAGVLLAWLIVMACWYTIRLA